MCMLIQAKTPDILLGMVCSTGSILSCLVFTRDEFSRGVVRHTLVGLSIFARGILRHSSR